jgi:acetyltransferase
MKRRIRMGPQAIRDIVLDTIHSLAPEADVRGIPPRLPLRQAVELDSMDWLNVFAGLEERLSLAIPPADHARLSTLDAIVDYVASRQAAGGCASAGPPPPQPEALPCAQHVIRGTPVLIRPMRNDDMPLEADFVRHLSRLSRYQRFMVTLNELPPAKLENLSHVDQQHHVALVAETLRQGERALAGVVRYVVDAAGTGCEFAVAIDDAWQGSGLAGILMHGLMAVARSRGLATMEGLVLRANDRMLKLARQLGFRQESDPQDHETVRVVRAL